MIAYKLMKQRKDGTLGPLFINSSQRVPLNRWLKAEAHKKKGFAFRPGWHAFPKPGAHTRLDTEREGRVWCRVEIQGVKQFSASGTEGGVWYLAKRMRVLEVLS